MSVNHMDNPFLEAVPVQLDRQVFFQRIYGRPVIPKGVSQANVQERQQWLSHLTELFIPTNLQTVAARLGHASVTTTGKIYAHAIQSADAAAADTLQDLLHPLDTKVKK